MMFFFFIFYRSIVKLKNRYVSNLPTFFHFDENGSYYLISRNKNIIINYIICNKKEYKNFQNDPNHDVSNCYEHELKIDDFDKGSIEEKGAYQFVFNKDNEYNNMKFIPKKLENIFSIVLKNHNKGNKKNNNIIQINNIDSDNIEHFQNDSKLENHLNLIKSANNFLDTKNIYSTNNKNESIFAPLNNSNDGMNDSEEIKEKDEIVVIFHNPKTYLDMNVYPCLFTKPLFAILVCLNLLLWIINWIMNFSKFCTIHIFLTLIIIDYLIYFILQSKELYFRNHSDLFTIFIPLRTFFLLLFQILFFSAILMLAKGWFIVHKSIKKLKIVYSFIYSILLALPHIIFQSNFINKNLGASLIKSQKDESCSDHEISNISYIDYFFTNLIFKYFSASNSSECTDLILSTPKNTWNFAFIGIEFIGVIFYYRDLIVSIEQSSEYVIAHLMVISESGIDPYTTPIMDKYIIYKGLSWGILIYLGAQQIVMLISYFCENFVAFWVQQLLYDIVNLFGIIGASFILKLNKKRLNGFMQLHSSSDGNQDENEVDSIDANENKNQSQLNYSMFETMDSNDESNANNGIIIRDQQTSDMNSNDRYHHHAPARITKRIVTRDEIERFNNNIGNKNNPNSIESSANNDNTNNQENQVDGTNEHQRKMVKWEEWMILPPQPIVSNERQVLDNHNNINDIQNHRDNSIEEELIHQDSV